MTLLFAEMELVLYYRVRGNILYYGNYRECMERISRYRGVIFYCGCQDDTSTRD